MIIRFLIIGYVFLGFFPKYIVADWKVAHLSYLMILNTFVFIYFLNKQKLKKSYYNLKSEHVLYFLFFLWGFVTLIKSVNLAESLMIQTELFTQLISFISIYFLLKEIGLTGIKFVFIGLSITLFLEITIILIEYFSNFKYHITSGRNNIAFRGITGNINIAAFSILLKIPVLFFFIIKENSYYKKLAVYILSTLSIFVIISVISSRASYLALLFMIFAFLLSSIIFRKNFKKSIVKQIFLFALLPTVLNVFFNIIIYKYIGKESGKSVVDRVESLSIGDTSTSQRLRYYSHAIDAFLENPFLGIGIGSWELESIKRDSQNIENYTVPYHVHNDYLEILAETGLIGFILYFGIFFLTVYRLILFIIKNREKLDENYWSIVLIVSLGIFLIDSFFNFPFARTLIMTQIFVFICLGLMAFETLSFEIRAPKKNIFGLSRAPILKTLFIITIVLYIPVIYSQYRVGKSYNNQAYLIGEFNANSMNRSIDFANKMEVEYPNLTATAMPLGFFKGVIYAKKQGNELEAIKIFQEHKKDNPYNYFGESQIGSLYYKLGKLDSAQVYTKKAFYGIPNNMIHYANYLKVLTRVGDTSEIKKIRDKINLNDNLVDELYLLAMAGLLDKDEGKDVLKSVEDITYSFDDEYNSTRASIYILNLGKEKVLRAHKIFNEGLTLFDNGKYNEALLKFKESHELNPLERAYAYNTANAYIRIGDDQSAIGYLNKIINKIDPKHGSSYYLRGLIYYDIGDKSKGCSDLNNAVDLGFRPAISILNRFCF